MSEQLAQQVLATETAKQTPETVKQQPDNTQVTPEQPGSLHENFAKLTKLERKLREERENFGKEKLTYEEKLKKLQELESNDSLWEQNPLEFMKKKGWDYEKLSKHVLSSMSDEDLDPIAKLQKQYDARMKEMETSTESRIKAAIEAKEKEYATKNQQAEITRFKSGVKDYVAQNKEKYELINKEGDEGYNTVFDIIQGDLVNQVNAGIEEKDLKMMTYEQACDKLESYLDSQLDSILSLNKVKSKLGQKLQNPRTITNEFSPRTGNTHTTEQERVEAAKRLVESGFLHN